jgi:hypothetical protein
LPAWLVGGVQEGIDAQGIGGMKKKSKPISDYKIGDFLYRYVEAAGTFKYIITGIRSYEGETQLEVECQTCSHGYKCRLLLARDDFDHIVHVHLLNDDEDSSQAMWHTNSGLYFVPTPEEAKKQGIAKLIAWNEGRVRDAEASLSAAKKRLQELKVLFEGVQP